MKRGNLSPWVMRIAHNLIIDHFRKISKQKNIKLNNDFDIFDIIENGENFSGAKSYTKTNP